ncbi:MAG: NAD(P)-dependent alcohol dehydrogenase [Candidatus Thorarchaeota archaeon]|nr:NAD(P)-dependent alcohol dehydrogenase [Candidatus Thorarchaeota archaeon]
MKAIVVSRYGPPEGLKFVDLDKSIPKENEVCVRIHATSVTAGDAMLRRMKLPLRWIMGLFMGGLGKNKVLGHEFAGVVESVGDEVSQYQPGDQVFGSTGMKGGAYAEFICVSEDSMIAMMPANLTFEEAAAIPIGGNTALHILKTGSLQAEQNVLIYGASGSVGSYAVQLAKYFGANVTGVCSTRNLKWVKEIGADETIDYTQDDFTKNGKSYDVIFDAVGKISRSLCKNVLRENGAFLTVRSTTKETQENLLLLKDLIERGKIRPIIDRIYTFNQITDAHSYADTGHKKGNIAITVIPSQK